MTYYLNLLDTMIDTVSDPMTFKNLLSLFLCANLTSKSGENYTTVAAAQRRLLTRIIDTLSSMKSDLIVSDPIGTNMIRAVRHLPRPLQRLAI